jgi:hypothetical protein
VLGHGRTPSRLHLLANSGPPRRSQGCSCTAVTRERHRRPTTGAPKRVGSAVKCSQINRVRTRGEAWSGAAACRQGPTACCVACRAQTAREGQPGALLVKQASTGAVREGGRGGKVTSHCEPMAGGWGRWPLPSGCKPTLSIKAGGMVAGEGAQCSCCRERRGRGVQQCQLSGMPHREVDQPGKKRDDKGRTRRSLAAATDPQSSPPVPLRAQTDGAAASAVQPRDGCQRGGVGRAGVSGGGVCMSRLYRKGGGA